MNRNYSLDRKQAHQNAHRIKANEQDVIASKEKRSAIYAAVIFLLMMGAIAVISLGKSIFIDKIAICLFIIGCILLIRLSGPSKQL